MKKKCLLAAFFYVALPSVGFCGELANVEYVHNFIKQKTGIDITIADPEPKSVANMKYLMCVLDLANAKNSTSSLATDYCNNVLATTDAVDTNAVYAAVGTLFNCKKLNYYKSAAMNPSDGTGAITCTKCPANYFCAQGGEEMEACADIENLNPVGGTYMVNPRNRNQCIYNMVSVSANFSGCSNDSGFASVLATSVDGHGQYGLGGRTLYPLGGYYATYDVDPRGSCEPCPKGSVCFASSTYDWCTVGRIDVGGSSPNYGNSMFSCSWLYGDNSDVNVTTAGTGASGFSDCIVGDGSMPNMLVADWPSIESLHGQMYFHQIDFDACAYNSTYNAHDAVQYMETNYPDYWMQGMCSNDTGTQFEIGAPTPATDGTGCWCRLKRRSDGANSGWVYNGPGELVTTTQGSCQNSCFIYCGYMAEQDSPSELSAMNKLINSFVAYPN